MLSGNLFLLFCDLVQFLVEMRFLLFERFVLFVEFFFLPYEQIFLPRNSGFCTLLFGALFLHFLIKLVSALSALALSSISSTRLFVSSSLFLHFFLEF